MESAISFGSQGRIRQRPIPVATPDPSGPLRVLLVAAHPIVRSSLARMLADRDDLDIVAEAADPRGLDALAGELNPDAILFAAGATPSEISEVVRVARDLSVPIVLIGDDSEVDFTALTAAGISGYVLPDANDIQIAAALHAVGAGLLVSGAPAPAHAETEPYADPRGADDPLTDREMQVLQLVANGLPNKGIARRLNISEHTVKFHVGSILSKLGVASRTEAVTQAAHRGLLTL